MGYYIERPDRENHGKAEWLITTQGAELLPEMPQWRDDKAIVCVVNNGPFEAAGYCYDPQELDAFSPSHDRHPVRPRKWLLLDKGIAEHLSGKSAR